ncbi:MAG: GNAT family N-acetyltransferase [Candidatus Nanoarchaeia archaeon]|nr:GNAT family N-acetyltransferase [Candidatus Nanoarchaeia archaeon]
MYKIKLIKDQEEINKLYNFIKQFSLDYPDYNIWLEKCKRELELGYKKAFVCEKNNQIIGNLIFQPHKEDPLLLEMKNGRVLDEYRRKNIFSSLVKNVIIYGKENNFKRVIGDAHITNEGMIKTLSNFGFMELANETIYDKQIEKIMIKDLNETSLDVLIRNLIIKLEIIIEELITKLKKLFILKCST